MWSWFVRINVQSIGSKFIFTSRLGKKYNILQRSQGMYSPLFFIRRERSGNDGHFIWEVLWGVAGEILHPLTMPLLKPNSLDGHAMANSLPNTILQEWHKKQLIKIMLNVKLSLFSVNLSTLLTNMHSFAGRIALW